MVRASWGFRPRDGWGRGAPGPAAAFRDVRRAGRRAGASCRRARLALGARRRQQMRVCIAVLLVSAAALAQQQDLSKVEVKATHVAGSVYMLQGSGGNIAASGGDA